MEPQVNPNLNTSANSVNGNLKFNIGAKQSGFIFKVSLFTGIAFLVVLALSYLFKYLIVDLQNQWVFDNQIYLMTASMIACFVITMVYNFSRNKSFLLLGIMYIAFIVFFSFGISSIFIYFEMNELFFIFAITGGVLLLNGIIGFFMSDKFAMSLMKIFSALFAIYFIAFFTYFFVSLFTTSGVVWYSYLITGLFGLIILISNCLQFYRLKQVNNYINMAEISKSDVTKLTIETSLTLLMSVIQTLILVARLYLFSSR